MYADMNDFYAAGALVIIDGKVLLFQRKGETGYDLPFGKRNPGETPEETAIREVREETGYTIRIIPYAPFSREGKSGLSITLLGEALSKGEPSHPEEGKAVLGDFSLLDTGRYPEYNRAMLQHFTRRH